MTVATTQQPLKGLTVHTARVIGAPAETLYHAWVDPTVVKSWWGVTEKGKLIACELDVRVGGTLFLAMSVPAASGQQVANGTFLEVGEGRRLVFSWSTDQGQIKDSRVSIEFTDLRDGSSRATVVHEGLPTPTVAVSQRAGWSDALQDLAIYVSDNPSR